MQRQAATAQPCQPPNHHNLNKPKQIHVAQLPLPNRHNLTSRQSPNPPKTPTPPQSPTPQPNPTTQHHKQEGRRPALYQPGATPQGTDRAEGPTALPKAGVEAKPQRPKLPSSRPPIPLTVSRAKPPAVAQD